MASIPTSRKESKFPKTIYDLIPNGDYDARIVRFIGLGVQEQPPYEGQEKEPAFKCSIVYELIGTDVTGKTEDGEAVDPRPACMFGDYFLFPGAERGNVFNLCKILDPSLTKVPGDIEWFTNKLGSVINVNVTTYKRKDGTLGNKINSLSPIPAKYQAGIGEQRTDLVGFDPYVDSPEMFGNYSKLYKFQHEILANAIDKENIPFAGKEPASLDGDSLKKKVKQDSTTSDATATATPSDDSDNDAPF